MKWKTSDSNHFLSFIDERRKTRQVWSHSKDYTVNDRGLAEITIKTPNTHKGSFHVIRIDSILDN